MRVYLDINATTPLDPNVRERMTQLMGEGPLNPGSHHAQGRRAKELWEQAQAELLDTLRLRETHRVVFCGSATEAMNLAIRGTVGASQGKPAIALSSVEHPAVSQTCEAVGECRVVRVNREGVLDVAALSKALEGAKLAAFMYANNETGGMLPAGKITALCRGVGVPLLLDCCQAPGKTEFPPMWGDSAPDMLVVSGHKAYGPVGIAALVVSKRHELTRQLTGGGQQHAMRAGTEPVILAAALATAMRIACGGTVDELSTMRRQTAALFDTIRAAAPHTRLTIPDAAMRLANTLHFSIPGVAAERLVIALDVEGVMCSAAAACESGAAKPSKVMLGMGYSEDEAKLGVRLSVGRFTTDEEIAFACDTLRQVLARLMR